MSIFTFLKKIWEGIKHLFDSLEEEAKQAIPVGITIVNKMKDFVEGSAVDILTAIIPGELDDNIKLRLREFLPKILIEMKLVNETLNLTDPNEIVQAAIRIFQQSTDDWVKDSAKKNFLDSVAVLVSQVAADGKLSWDDAKYVLKWYYDHEMKSTPSAEEEQPVE